MATRQRPGDMASEDARRAVNAIGIELRNTRLALGLSLATVARAAGMSASQVGRLERARIHDPTLDQLYRVGRVLGLIGMVRFLPFASPVRDAGQLALFARFEALLPSPLGMRREVGIPIPGDLRAWDGLITGDQRPAFVEGEAHLGDIQALARRIELKLRDDPRGEVVILVVARTVHNRSVLREHREALRAQLPLDGPAVRRALRAGLIPPAGGIIVV